MCVPALKVGVTRTDPVNIEDPPLGAVYHCIGPYADAVTDVEPPSQSVCDGAGELFVGWGGGEQS